MFSNMSNVFRFSRLTLLTAFICMALATGCEKDDSDSGGGTVVTQAEYNEIQNGMSYSQVVAIIGAKGQEVASNGSFVFYKWTNSNGSYAQVEISNVSGLSAYGLGSGVIAKFSSGNLP